MRRTRTRTGQGWTGVRADEVRGCASSWQHPPRRARERDRDGLSDGRAEDAPGESQSTGTRTSGTATLQWGAASGAGDVTARLSHARRTSGAGVCVMHTRKKRTESAQSNHGIRGISAIAESVRFLREDGEQLSARSIKLHHNMAGGKNHANARQLRITEKNTQRRMQELLHNENRNTQRRRNTRDISQKRPWFALVPPSLLPVLLLLLAISVRRVLPYRGGLSLAEYHASGISLTREISLAKYRRLPISKLAA